MQQASTVGTQGICPTGWHVLIRAEVLTLEATLGNDIWALFAFRQLSGTNTTDFPPLLAGYHGGIKFSNTDTGASYWNSIENFGSNASV